jgi:hypothetical protein
MTIDASEFKTRMKNIMTEHDAALHIARTIPSYDSNSFPNHPPLQSWVSLRYDTYGEGKFEIRVPMAKIKQLSKDAVAAVRSDAEANIRWGLDHGFITPDEASGYLIGLGESV